MNWVSKKYATFFQSCNSNLEIMFYWTSYRASQPQEAEVIPVELQLAQRSLQHRLDNNSINTEIISFPPRILSHRMDALFQTTSQIYNSYEIDQSKHLFRLALEVFG